MATQINNNNNYINQLGIIINNIVSKYLTGNNLS